MLDHYRSARYQDGGRGERVGGIRLFDCYGLATAVRAEQFGFEAMPGLTEVAPSNARHVHRASLATASGLQSCDAQPGAMALCWQGSLALHCGVVVPVNGRLGVLECHRDTHVRWQPLRQFSRDYTNVEFYT
ncbi:hypothetical protein [Vreelandella profundi]|uniref:hypothetical protein n=1 Tax=Vreelandella profundi TaxID=2852117 RepID=UPI001F3093BB|nr:hypothetical protein [Halomonas profundi]